MPGEPANSESLLNLFRALYRQYAAEFDWTTEEMASQGRIRDFVEWCRRKDFPAARKEDLQGSGVPEGVIDAVTRLLSQDDFTVAGVLFPLWDRISLVGRPPISPQPILSLMEVVLVFDDWRELSIRNPAAFYPGRPYDDGQLLTMLWHQFASIREELRKVGCTEGVARYGRLLEEDRRASFQKLIQRLHEG